jgi:hypothetical protein
LETKKELARNVKREKTKELKEKTARLDKVNHDIAQ